MGLYVHPSPYSGTYMEPDNTLPGSRGWIRKQQLGFTSWQMPHNQLIGQWESEIRNWTHWPLEACDLSTIHLCPHVVPLNVWRSDLPLKSPPLTKQADAAIGLSIQIGLLGHNTTPTSFSLPLQTADPGLQFGDPGPSQKTQKTLCQVYGPFQMTESQTKLFQRWVMGSTGPYWKCLKDNSGLFETYTMANFIVRSNSRLYWIPHFLSAWWISFIF